MVVLVHFVVNTRVATKNRKNCKARMPALPNNLLSNFIVFGMIAESSYLSCRDDII
jgi:hypothetical protein